MDRKSPRVLNRIILIVKSGFRMYYGVHGLRLEIVASKV